MRSVLDAARSDRSLRKALAEAAAEADATLVQPLLEFRNFGVPLPHNWTTVVNSAEFGTDYYTRTAVAKSNIFINRPRETRYFYQDLDATARVSTAPGATPSPSSECRRSRASGRSPFTTSIHFFAPNEIDRFSLGTKSKQLRFEADGSLAIYVQKEQPDDDRVSNWLPAPDGDFSLYIRAYWPLPPISRGSGPRRRSFRAYPAWATCRKLRRSVPRRA